MAKNQQRQDGGLSNVKRARPSTTFSQNIPKGMPRHLLSLYASTLHTLSKPPRKQLKPTKAANVEPEAIKEELFHAKARMNELVDERKILMTKVRTLEQELNKMDRRYEELLIINNASQPSSTIIEDKIVRNLRIALKNAEKKIKELEKEVRDLKNCTRFTNLAKKEKECRSLFQETLRLRRSLAHNEVHTRELPDLDSAGILELDTQVDELREKLARTETEKNDLARQLATADREKENLRGETDQNVQIAMNLQETISSLKADLEDANREKSLHMSKIRVLEATLVEIQHQYDSLETSHRQTKNELDLSSHHTKALTDELTSLQQSNIALRKQVEQLQLDAAEAGNENTELRSQLKELSERLVDCQAQSKASQKMEEQAHINKNVDMHSTRDGFDHEGTKEKEPSPTVRGETIPSPGTESDDEERTPTGIRPFSRSSFASEIPQETIQESDEPFTDADRQNQEDTEEDVERQGQPSHVSSSADRAPDEHTDSHAIESNGGVDTERMEEAARTIRGVARKWIAEKRARSGNNVRETPIDHEKAAVKIQAAVRGFLARKHNRIEEHPTEIHNQAVTRSPSLGSIAESIVLSEGEIEGFDTRSESEYDF